jgi:hypothetical protein
VGKFEYPIHGLSWTAGCGAPAGIYWLGGRSIIAAHGSSAEGHLIELGAILMATLRFDGPAYDCSHAGRRVQRVQALQWIQFTG